MVDSGHTRDLLNQLGPHDDLQTSSETEICLPKEVLLLLIGTTFEKSLPCAIPNVNI